MIIGGSFYDRYAKGNGKVLSSVHFFCVYYVGFFCDRKMYRRKLERGVKITIRVVRLVIITMVIIMLIMVIIAIMVILKLIMINADNINTNNSHMKY